MTHPNSGTTGSGGTPALDADDDTVAIPRPADELDGEPIEDEPDDDPEMAG